MRRQDKKSQAEPEPIVGSGLGTFRRNPEDGIENETTPDLQNLLDVGRIGRRLALLLHFQRASAFVTGDVPRDVDRLNPRPKADDQTITIWISIGSLLRVEGEELALTELEVEWQRFEKRDRLMQRHERLACVVLIWSKSFMGVRGCAVHRYAIKEYIGLHYSLLGLCQK